VVIYDKGNYSDFPQRRVYKMKALPDMSMTHYFIERAQFHYKRNEKERKKWEGRQPDRKKERKKEKKRKKPNNVTIYKVLV
jgi:hypothetical protein